MNLKRGFTLIELLAVIIILAIIALIATPIILDVVEDARKSAGLSEANMIYSGINNYCATEDVKYQLDNNYTKICTSDMDINDVPTMVNLGNAKVIEIEYSDKLTWLKVKSNGHTYSLQDNAMVEGNLDKPEAAYAVGDLLKVQVSDSETQNIYVLEVNGNEIVGILDRNLPGGTVAWISEEDYNTATGRDFGDDWNNYPEQLNENLYTYGPITALAAMNERTSSWNKVNKIEIPEAEEMLKLTEYYKELESSGETSNWESKYFTDFNNFMMSNESIQTCSSGSECREAITIAGGAKYLLPEWATINLETTGDSSAGFGYWTKTPAILSVVSDPSGAWLVYVFGYLYFGGDGFVCDSDLVGVRPVIHIYESNILSKLEAPEYVNPDDVVGAS